ncbi:MAG TPA: hypothetical protein PKZ22_08260 [Accumulibacter sp.]|jgi:hypothetical protein|nr:hypothetical protein [Accumulibacter sp.]
MTINYSGLGSSFSAGNDAIGAVFGFLNVYSETAGNPSADAFAAIGSALSAMSYVVTELLTAEGQASNAFGIER